MKPAARQRAASYYDWDADVLVLNILGRPAAPRDAIGRVQGTQLRVSVRAVPEGGRATDHLVRFLAPLFGVPVSQIEVVFGRESVHKQLRIRAPRCFPPELAELASRRPPPRPA
ncbi:MAG: DUF167 domain-containing protein [Rhodoferax sp.]|nr:DUF167 domain-containing protein [Rhodoferax sp.]